MNPLGFAAVHASAATTRAKDRHGLIGFARFKNRRPHSVDSSDPTLPRFVSGRKTPKLSQVFLIL